MDRSPLSFAVARRHHSDSALPFAPLHPKPAAHAMLPDFRLAPRSYSPASLDAYRLRSSASASAISSSSAASTPPVAATPTASPSPSSDRALPPISSILAGSVEAAATLAYCAATAASAAPRDRAHSWPTRPLPPAAVSQLPHLSPVSAPAPILAKDTPASSIANSPAPSSVFSAAGSPYSVASDLDCVHHNHSAAYHYAEPDRAVSPAPTAAPERPPCPDVTTIDGRPAFNSYLQKPSPSTSPRPHHHSDSASPSTSADRYVCQVCSRAFSRPSSLRIHSHSHTGEKPFVCGHDGCGKAFSVRSNMKRHERGCHAG
ncbi:hypothetical protein POJ06DRAFT_251369 [Lipomyces tetrasporus]|uniref:C2H2-type domain-containing protein n=1 Tax=Lipomyces tetrasporus TaxID=54092 RepID=A0AAD7QU75_9ASCO|nr:uncharacterized protein POJ06DRAFT_251369 [Lipomyces tetrasporus]KAJ8101386.1 hypothetical protein POJ06DRAFT_251369 [Lipomyces tetrasporus]